MKNQAAIQSFTRYPQDGDRVAYFLGDTTIIAEEWTDTDGVVHLRPVRGDQVSCGEWYDLADDEVAAYCELLEDEMRKGNYND